MFVPVLIDIFFLIFQLGYSYSWFCSVFMDIFFYFSAGMEAPWFTSYLFIRTCLEYTPNLILACLTVYQ